MRIGLGWKISSFFGWGIYGLNLALEWSREADLQAFSAYPVGGDDVIVDSLRAVALAPLVRRSGRVQKDGVVWLQPLGYRMLGNPMLGEAEPGGIGIAFIERPLANEAIERAKRYKLIISGSSWNERLLRDAGVENVRTVLQGVDPTLFHPAPKFNLFPGKFLIFSGGNAEPRKGQDLVVKAFRIFAQRDRDATLVTAWHSPYPNRTQGMDLDLSSFADRVIDVGIVPNALMPAIYRECNVALFPNRAEGGTNLVAMECLACGVPTILSANTGHLDLPGAHMLTRQKFSNDGWGESDVDEIVHALETAKREHWQPAERNVMAEFTWSRTARELKSLL